MLNTRYTIVARALGLAAAFRSSAIALVCKIPLLARAIGLKAARPSARATIGYLVYNDRTSTSILHTKCAREERDLAYNLNNRFKM